jgi:hypothetical protein
MSHPAASSLRPRARRLFQAVKYLTFTLLCMNVWLFLGQELASASHSVQGDLALTDVVQLFSATLDTAAWVVLLLLFELETAVIPDHRLVGATRWCIHSLRLLCTLAILSAFYGYWEEWRVLEQVSALTLPSCELVDAQWSVLLGLDDFAQLTGDNCVGFSATLYQLTELDRVLVTPEVLAETQWLAITDVVNAAAWILVVIVLELEVRLLPIAGGFSARVAPLINGSKILLYATLAVAAIYWGFEGDFLDFWDAALWLFAFVFIEMNVFEWQREVASPVA